MPELLAIDLDALASIHLQVPGSPLKRAIRYYPPLQRRVGRRLYRLVGRALQIIESTGASVPVPSEAPRAAERIEADLLSARSQLTPSEYEGISEVIDQYWDSVTTTAYPELVWSHGDISRTNILQNGDDLAIIDFSWAPELPYRDVVHFLARVETDIPTIRAWSAELTGEVLSGFGVDRLKPPAALRLAYVQRALRSLAKPHARTQTWGRRAYRKILAEPDGPI